MYTLIVYMIQESTNAGLVYSINNVTDTVLATLEEIFSSVLSLPCFITESRIQICNSKNRSTRNKPQNEMKGQAKSACANTHTHTHRYLYIDRKSVV